MDSDLMAVEELVPKALHMPSLVPRIVEIARMNYNSASRSRKISDIVIRNVYQAKTEDKLFSLFLLDSLLRQLGPVYTNYFSAQIIGMFINSYKLMRDDGSKEALLFLKRKWAEIFPKYVIDRLDDELFKVDPNVFNTPQQYGGQIKGGKRKMPQDFHGHSEAKVPKNESQHCQRPPMNRLNQIPFSGQPLTNMPPLPVNPFIAPPKFNQPIPDFSRPPPKFSQAPPMTNLPMRPPAALQAAEPQNMTPTNLVQSDISQRVVTSTPLAKTMPNMSSISILPKSYKPSNTTTERNILVTTEIHPVQTKNTCQPIDPSKVNLEVFPNLSEEIEMIAIKDLDLKSYSHLEFRKFNKLQVDKLYSGIPCQECGLRFKDTLSNEYQQHMLFHEHKSHFPLVKRKNNMNYIDWVKAPKINFNPVEVISNVIQHPMFEEKEKNICGVCYQGFDVKRDEEGDFMLQNAQLVDGAVYHPICVSDIRREYGASDDSTPEEEKSLHIEGL